MNTTKNNGGDTDYYDLEPKWKVFKPKKGQMFLFVAIRIIKVE